MAAAAAWKKRLGDGEDLKTIEDTWTARSR